ncbi:MAG TPA: pilus assembly protein TadG-related protein, partial [Reyranella sp.]|nr:pilus assembly protein TadG-related protein [Reyranella sp.]
MERSISSAPRAIRGLLRDRTGATAILFGFMAVGLMGTAGLTIDVGQVFVAKRNFAAATEAAALAGAYALSQNNATQGTVQAAITAWNTAHPPSKVTITNTSVAVSCDTATSNLPSCNGTSPNVAQVTQTATVSTHFMSAFGIPSITLTSTASASKAGGTSIPLNVLFVLDATQSMNSADTGCTVPGIAH